MAKQRDDEIERTAPPAPAGNLQKYGEYTEEGAAQDERDASAGGNFFKPKVGKNRLRVLPPKPGQMSPFFKLYEHTINLASGKMFRFACARKLLSQPCPACARAEELDASGNKADEDAAKGLWPRMRVYSAVIDRAEPDKGVQVYAFGRTVLDRMAEIRRDREEWPDGEGGGNFTHPLTGFDIILARKGTGRFDTEYRVAAAKARSPLSEDDDEAAAWLGAMPDLGRFKVLRDAKSVERAMEGEEDEDDARPSPRSGGGGKRGRTVADDVDGADDDELPF